MDYEKLHKNTLIALQQRVSEGIITEEIAKSICADFVKESEDEKIRKVLVDFFKDYVKNISLLDNSKANVKFPFKAKVKSNGKIATIHGGQLNFDGKEWIKYQSDAEDGYKIYEPDSLELVCEIEQKPAWNKDDENGLSDALWAIQQARTIAKNENEMGCLWYAENWLNSIKERIKGE